MAAKYRNALFCLALIAIVALVYSPGLSGRFLFDDYPNIVSNPQVQATTLTWDAIARAAKGYEHGAFGRPLATVSFALNYIVGGNDPFGFKVTGLAVHLLNTFLVYLLLRALLSPSSQASGSNRAPLVISLIWAIHPLLVSSVLYVVQRMETLSLTFVLAALLAYLQGRRAQLSGARGWPWLLACVPLVLLGLMSKETALLFPAYTLALEFTLLGFGAHSPRTAKTWRWSYALAATAGLLLFAFVIAPPYLDPSIYEFRGFSLTERLMTQLRVLVLYLGQMLLPLPSWLTFYYDDLLVSKGFLHPASTLLCGLLLAVLATVGYKVRNRAPVFSLGIMWFFAAHLLTSNVFPLEMAFEHRNYFALLGILLAISDVVRRIPMRDGPALKYIAVGAIVIGFGLLTVLRSATWGNSLGLAMDLVNKNPMSARASNDLAEQYMVMADGNKNSPFFSMAVTEFERGSRLPGSSPLPEQGLILLAGSVGEPAQEIWWQRLIEKLHTRPLGPQEQGAIAGLVKHRYEGIEIDDRHLAEAYAILAERSELPPFVYAQFGDHALRYLHDDALADRMFAAAIDSKKVDSKYAVQLLGALLTDGHVRQAEVVEARARALGLMPPMPAPSARVVSP